MLLLMLLAVGTLYALNATSNAPNRYKNGFERKLIALHSSIVTQRDFGIAFRELAGISGDSLFIMGPEPGKVYITDVNLFALKMIKLADPKIKKIIPRFYTTVNFPDIFILGGNAKAFAKGDLNNGKTHKQALHLPGIFGNPVLVGNEFLMRVVDSTTLNASFVSVNQWGMITMHETGISPQMGDAGMINSGLLKYDKKHDRMVYLHFYDNSIDVFSTQLRPMYEWHTIDTVYHNPTQVVVSGKSVAYKHPPVAVNGYMAIHDGMLYVRSKLMADNEDPDFFSSHTAIDKYDLTTGRYLGSFYLENIGRKQIGQFYFLDDAHILAFSEGHVIIYKLSVKERLERRSSRYNS